MYLWGRRWSPRLTPLPSWSSSWFVLLKIFLISFLQFSLSLFILLSTVSIFLTISLNSLCGKWLSPFHLVLFLRFYLVLSFGRYSFVSSFCLTLCVCFYVLGISAVSPSIERVALCRRLLWGSVAHSPGHESGAPGVSPAWIVCSCLLWLGCIYVGTLVGWVGPWPAGLWLGYNCCGHADVWGWPPAWLSMRAGHNCFWRAGMQSRSPREGDTWEEHWCQPWWPTRWGGQQPIWRGASACCGRLPGGAGQELYWRSWLG